MLSRTDRLNSTNFATEPSRIDHRQVDAVHENPSTFGQIKPLNQFRKRAFARPRGAHNADDLPLARRSGGRYARWNGAGWSGSINTASKP
jgi:hypothetical protein